ncbi:tetratricopeptide repeat protein [Granulicella paludicola]|jgi:tetratricopeptide (TPR) repeat protein|uniref:tetratricopeptide repeat protein n=1 Tax=Granulicella paludicola TaxID=474951 RepID=UPI0021DF5D48|nr:tetratricopeptide repeat protein [Granulicella paludicola]
MTSTGCYAATAAPSANAERILVDGRVDDAIHLLQGELSANPNDGDAHLLLCRAYLAERALDEAVRECESAVRLNPRSAVVQDWLGRAYGVKADNAGPLTGIKLALRVRDAFQSAVNLDPHNREAINDLAEYYTGAPSVVGGGFDKALALAGTVEGEYPQLAHRIRGRAAEKQKDYGTAEREYRAAIAVKNAPDAWVDLGGMFKRRKQTNPAIDAIQHAFAADKAKDDALVDGASFLIDMNVQPDAALKALQQYLASNAKTDQAPVIQVHVLIAKILDRNGDKTGATNELNKALALASNYAPARRALQEL